MQKPFNLVEAEEHDIYWRELWREASVKPVQQIIKYQPKPFNDFTLRKTA